MRSRKTTSDEQLVNRTLLFLIPLLSLPPIHGASPSHISEWKKRYYLDRQANQEYLGATASFIAYLLRQEPGEQVFNHELELVKKYYPKAPNYLQLAVLKVYKNCYLYAYKDAVLLQGTSGTIEPSLYAWKKALLTYYEALYPLLENKTFSYGSRKGKSLKDPAELHKRLAEIQ